MKATFGAGCFWSVQDSFDKIKGVSSSLVGFMGGLTKNPTYNDVCSGVTSHSEVVTLEFDSKVVSYDELLKVFFSIHDPAQLNKPQYKSVIFYHNESQRVKAVTFKNDLIKKGVKIVTEIMPASAFYKAEEYHQKYYKKNNGGCHI